MLLRLKTICCNWYLFIMSDHQSSSLFYKAYHPALQATVVLGAGLIMTLLAKLIHLLGILEVGNRFPWQCAASFLLFFAVFNAIFSLSTKDLNNYRTKSMVRFGGLALLSGLLAWGFSGISITEAGSYSWIFVVLTFGYLVFLSMMGLMKWIVEFAEKEKWQSPRRRRKK